MLARESVSEVDESLKLFIEDDQLKNNHQGRHGWGSSATAYTKPIITPPSLLQTLWTCVPESLTTLTQLITARRNPLNGSWWNHVKEVLAKKI